MRKVFDHQLMSNFIERHHMEDIFDVEILQHAQLHFYERNEVILQADTILEYYYLLVDGKIRISYLFENGKSMLLKFYKEFSTIGDMELLRNVPILCNIDAVEDTYLVALPADLLRTQYFDNLKLLHHLVDSLSDKLYATINNSSYNFVYPLINRLSSYLLEHLEYRDSIILHSSYLEIAQFLGTTYRHLNRTLKELEEKAIIRCEGKKIFILDKTTLQDLAKNIFLQVLE